MVIKPYTINVKRGKKTSYFVLRPFILSLKIGV